MAAVTIEHVVKRYTNVTVIHDLSVAAADGEFVALVGPSGCGKSTLLRMIAGLEDISEGEIRIGDHVVNDLLPRDRNVAMVFQNYALYPHMTVANNMGFSLKLLGEKKPEISRKVREAARILGLDDLLDRFPGQLSGGQRQRAAMGRAIVRDPQVFLFDEPLSNLDAKLRVQMRAEIKSLHQRLRTTTIYVTHDQIEAMTMADRIVVMNQGKIEQIGSPLDLYDEPRNAFVAGFIGAPSMNFIPGRVAQRDGTPVFETDRGNSLPLRAGEYPGGQRALYGVRPEHFALAGDDRGVGVSVQLVEPTGSETQVLMDIGGDPVTGLFRERIRAASGSSLRVEPDIECIHLFDAETGERIDRAASA